MRRGLDAFGEDADAWRRAVGARVPGLRSPPGGGGGHLRPTGRRPRRGGARSGRGGLARAALSAGYDRPLLLMAALRAEALRAGPRHPLFAAIGATRSSRRRHAGGAGGGAGRRAGPAVRRPRDPVGADQRDLARRGLALAGGAGGRAPIGNARWRSSTSGAAAASTSAPKGCRRLERPAGGPFPVASSARIVARQGFDVQPLDVGRAEDIKWLRACIWPGENDRLARLDRAAGYFCRPRRAPIRRACTSPTWRTFPRGWHDGPRAAGRDRVCSPTRPSMRDYLPEASRSVTSRG